MKRIIIVGFLISSMISINPLISHAQEMTKEDYLHKSRQQKTAAWMLLGGGAILEVTGGFLFVKEGVNDLGNAFSGSNTEDYKSGIGVMVLGGAAMLGSIPLFVSASNNRQKAYSISFKSQPLEMPRLSTKSGKNIPALTISIPMN